MALGSQLTMAGAVLGTPKYMAPEQHLGAPASEATDQFNFCEALYEALFRRAPFRGKFREALKLEVSQGRLREPPSKAGVPARVRRAVMRGLATSEGDRLPSMRALLEELRHDPRPLQWRLALAVVVLVIAGAALFGWTPSNER